MLVWLASYPRSGNTFLRVIFREVFGIETYSLYDETEETCPVASNADNAAIDDQPSPTRGYDVDRFGDRPELHVVKTHHLPFDDRRTIYIIRDGRASIASYFHYIRDIEHGHPTMASVIAGMQTFGSWSDHVRGWNPANRPDTLFLRFERLVDDPIGHLPILAEFLGIPPVNEQIPTFEELHARAPRFFRSGRTDSSRTQYTPAELSLLESLHGDVLQEFGYALEADPGVHPGEMLRQVIAQVNLERRQLHELAVWQGDELRKHQMILADAATAARKLEESLNLGRAA